MLVLSRRIGESIIIGQNVKITLLATQGLQARIGIDAPDCISVHREEIFNRIKKQEELQNDEE